MRHAPGFRVRSQIVMGIAGFRITTLFFIEVFLQNVTADGGGNQASRATTSISTFTSRGSRATSTVERAGVCAPKRRAYTLLRRAKSSRSFTKTVDLTTWARDAPGQQALKPSSFLAALRMYTPGGYSGIA